MSTQSTVLHTLNQKRRKNASSCSFLLLLLLLHIIFYTKTIFLMPFASRVCIRFGLAQVWLDFVMLFGFFSLSPSLPRSRSVNETDRSVWYAVVSTCISYAPWMNQTDTFSPFPSHLSFSRSLSHSLLFIALLHVALCCCPCRTNTLMQTQTIRYCVCSVSEWIVCPHCTQISIHHMRTEN